MHFNFNFHRIQRELPSYLTGEMKSSNFEMCETAIGVID